MTSYLILDNAEVKANTSANIFSYNLQYMCLVVKITYEYYAVQKTWDNTRIHFYTKEVILHSLLLHANQKFYGKHSSQPKNNHTIFSKSFQ